MLLDNVFYFLIGITAGFMSGMFGIGGGTVRIPLLNLAGLPLLTAFGINFLVIPFSSLVGAISHRKNIAKRRSRRRGPGRGLRRLHPHPSPGHHLRNPLLRGGGRHQYRQNSSQAGAEGQALQEKHLRFVLSGKLPYRSQGRQRRSGLPRRFQKPGARCASGHSDLPDSVDLHRFGRHTHILAPRQHRMDPRPGGAVGVDGRGKDRESGLPEDEASMAGGRAYGAGCSPRLHNDLQGPVSAAVKPMGPALGFPRGRTAPEGRGVTPVGRGVTPGNRPASSSPGVTPGNRPLPISEGRDYVTAPPLTIADHKDITPWDNIPGLFLLQGVVA